MVAAILAIGTAAAAEVSVGTLAALTQAVGNGEGHANEGDIVRITTDISVNSPINVYQSVTITANEGKTLTQAGDVMMFCLQSGTTATFQELTIIGNSTGTKAAIEVSAGTASIENCTFQNWKNTAETSQGVICVKGSGTLSSINGATFTGCEVTSGRGIIFLGKSGMTLSGTLTFTGCTADYEIYNEGYNFTEETGLIISNSSHENKLRVACQRVPSGIHAKFAINGTLDKYAITKLFSDTNNVWHLIKYGNDVVFSAPIMVQNGETKTYFGNTQLATAVDNAVSGSTIHIYEDCIQNNRIMIGKTLTFLGHDNAKVTRSTDNSLVLFCNEANGDATYKNLTIVGVTGNTSAAIEASTGSATINNCTFLNWTNSAGNSQGVLCVKGNGAGTITINGATFTGCEVTSGRGLIFIGSNSHLTIGGAIAIDGSTGYDVYTENTAFTQGANLSITKNNESGTINIARKDAPTTDATTLVTNGTLAKYALGNLASYTGWVVRQNGTDVEVGKAYIKVTNSTTDTYLDDLHTAVTEIAEEGATVTVLKDYALTRSIAIPTTMTITSSEGITITRATEFTTGVAFACNAEGATATLQDLVLNGSDISDTQPAIACSNGTIAITNVTITNWQNNEEYGKNQGIVCCKGNGAVTMTNCNLTGNTISNWAGLVFVGNNNLTLNTGNSIPSADNSTTENPTYGTSSIYIERGYYITTTAVPSNALELALAADYYERTVVMSENDVLSQFCLSKDTQKRFASLQEEGSTHNLAITGDDCVKNEQLNRYYTDLASAINDATSGQTLTILKNCLISSPADMGKTLTINNGTDGKGSYTVKLCPSVDYRQNGKTSPIPFYGAATDGDITFNNVIFDGDNQPHNSAFAEMAQGKVTFNGCTFKNIINNYGEAVNEKSANDKNQGIVCCKVHHKDEQNHLVGGKVIINDCTFTDNQVYNGFGIIFIGNADMTVKGSTNFSNNKWRDGDVIAGSTAYDIYLERNYVNLKNETLSDITWTTPVNIWIENPVDGYTFLSCKGTGRNNRDIMESGKFIVLNENWYQYIPCNEIVGRRALNDWKYSFHPNDVRITAPVSASLAAEITSSGIPYTTFCAKYDAKVPTGLKAWRAVSEDGVVATFQSIDDGVIPGYEGVVLTHDTYYGPDSDKNSAADAFSGVITNNDEAGKPFTAVNKFKVSENMLRGSVEPYAVDQTNYYYYTMSKGQTISRGRLTYTMYTGTSNLPANKSFFRIARTDEEGKSNYGKFVFSFFDNFSEATGINNVNVNANANDNAIYDINGRKVATVDSDLSSTTLSALSLPKGIYIYKGKKIVF